MVLSKVGLAKWISLQRLQAVPLWLAIMILGAIGVIISILLSEESQEVLGILAVGLRLTVLISVSAYLLALLIGLIVGIGRTSKNPIVHTLATLYVEIMRGIPILVVILYVAFVISPKINVRSDILRAIAALALSYGAYLAEVYRSGIEAIPRGQREAARALGLSPFQTMIYVVLPQAFRIILPPLGNDFIALLKDSSLASVIGVAELTQQTRFYVSRTFDTFGGWTMTALLYLSLTLLLSLLVRVLERYSQARQR